MTDGFLFNLEQVSITFRQNLATSSLSEAHNLSIACLPLFMSTSTKTTGVGQVIRSDVCGPMQVSTLTGERYYVVFTHSTTVKINWHFFRQMDLFQPSQWRHSTLTHQFDDSANSQSYGKYCNYIVCQKFFIWFNLPLNYVNPKFCTSYWTWATPFGHSN